MKTNQPPILTEGDKVTLISSARKVKVSELEYAVNTLDKWGLQIRFGAHLYKKNHQFAGTVDDRRQDLQSALDDHTIKAVFFVRGGYGSIQIVDLIDWSAFKKNPKWLVGFSDITVFHSHIHQNLRLPSLHAPMPITYPNNTQSSLSNLRKILFGHKIQYNCVLHPLNKMGRTSGELVGGNLSILYSLLGSKSQMNTQGKLLFIEDLDEYLYHLDRMAQALDRAGMLNKLSGLIVGGMSDMNDNSVPYGKSAECIILDVVSKYDFPVVFDFPAGHIDNNQPLVFGAKYSLCVTDEKVRFEQKITS